MKFGIFLAFGSALLAQAPVRPVPPPGVTVPEADGKALEAGLSRLDAKLKLMERSPLYADVAIFHKAVHYALRYNEFFKPEEMARGRELLAQGETRADEFLSARVTWPQQTGLVVRGYISKIDKSVQPYALVIPPSYRPNSGKRWRLDTWFHGRSEMLSEVNFLYDRQRNAGEFTAPDTFVLHLYGRYCNANKFAGEVDLFEALDAVKAAYPIDDNRIVVRGFSMGGAAAWHIAAHHAGLWAAAAPGAGFSETPEFLQIKPEEMPAAYEQKLWRLYNATDYAANLFNCPTVAYSGEIDRQIQAAQAMEKALGAEGMRLRHVIGPQTPHRYHPDSKVEINQAIDAIAERGRDRFPRRVRFTTWTLRYDRMKWVRVDALEKHWERGRVEAEVAGDHHIGVQAFTLDFGPGQPLLAADAKIVVTINGQPVRATSPLSDGSWSQSFVRKGTQWQAGSPEGGLRKRHGLQGPVDDAFMDSFLVVKPTGPPLHEATGKWVQSEMDRAIREWRRHWRGDAMVKNDFEITDADIASSNLVLWGDPQSNRVYARIADKLPLRWGKEHEALILIYPNPLNPAKYVVINSGPTFREYDYLNNARQVPKLPDWAVIDVRTPPDARYPGKIVDAGFFSERWTLAGGGADRKPTGPPSAARARDRR